jgi:hypothetical protein
MSIAVLILMGFAISLLIVSYVTLVPVFGHNDLWQHAFKQLRSIVTVAGRREREAEYAMAYTLWTAVYAIADTGSRFHHWIAATVADAQMAARKIKRSLRVIGPASYFSRLRAAHRYQPRHSIYVARIEAA